MGSKIGLFVGNDREARLPSRRVRLRQYIATQAPAQPIPMKHASSTNTMMITKLKPSPPLASAVSLPSLLAESPTVGARVGCVEVGTVVGVNVGAGTVGSLVGPGVGETVGKADGGLVGSAVGVMVGCVVGSTVGTNVGKSVGLVVGWCDGAADGTVVGAAIGIAVGDAVGISVGVAVGVGHCTQSNRARGLQPHVKMPPWVGRHGKLESLIINPFRLLMSTTPGPLVSLRTKRFQPSSAFCTISWGRTACSYTGCPRKVTPTSTMYTPFSSPRPQAVPLYPDTLKHVGWHC